MHENENAWKSVKGRSQNKQSQQKSKNYNDHNNRDTASQNTNLVPTPSTAVFNGNSNVSAKPVGNKSQLDNNCAANARPINSGNATTNLSSVNSTNLDRNSASFRNSSYSSNARRPPSIASDPPKQQRNGVTNSDPRKALDREIKSLVKYEANVKNTRWHFEEEIKKSQDRFKRAFIEMRERLNQRERDLALELDNCKLEGLQLLNAREETEHQLRTQTARVNSSTNSNELEDLRQQIRKFLHEKRIEDDLGRTLRFQYEPDKLISCIDVFGEVQPIYGRSENAKKSPSVASLISADGVDALSIDTLSISANKQNQQPVINQVNFGGLVIKSDNMNTNQLADLTRQFQENLRLQGITDDILPEVTDTITCPMPQRRPQPASNSARKGGIANRNQNNRQSNKKPASKIV